MSKRSKATKEEIEVEIIEDAASEIKNEKKEVIIEASIDAKDSKQDEFERKFKELQEKMEKTDAERKAAQERADRLEKEKEEVSRKAQQAEGRAASSQKDQIMQAISSSEQSLSLYRKELKAALESGDSDKSVEMQEKLAEATYLHSELKKNKTGYEQWEKQQEEIAKQPKNTMTSETKAWIDRNPRFNTDQEFRIEAESAHYAAINRGIRPDTVAYFEFIDKRLGRVFDNTAIENRYEDVKQETKQREVNYSAPPTRGDSSSDRGVDGKEKIRLTAAQVEAAEFMGMSPVEYWEYLKKEKGRK